MQLLRPNEIARMFGVTALTVRRWIAEPERYGLRKIAIGERYIGVPKADVDALMSKGVPPKVKA
jgi:hypothetical protein